VHVKLLRWKFAGGQNRQFRLQGIPPTRSRAAVVTAGFFWPFSTLRYFARERKRIVIFSATIGQLLLTNRQATASTTLFLPHR
jgi:hypothetical protein